jgi:hypothetical protein
MATFSAAEIVGKTLIAKSQVNVYSLPDVNKQYKIAVVKKGAYVGTVYSWIQKPGGLFWQFQSGNSFYYVKHFTGAFDVTKLKKQGTLTVEEQTSQEEFEKLNQIQKLGYNVKQFVAEKSTALDSTVKKVLIYAGLGIGLYFLVKNEVKNTGILKKLKL